MEKLYIGGEVAVIFRGMMRILRTHTLIICRNTVSVYNV